MYSDALEFLEDERAAWLPFEALLDLSDADLAGPLDGVHGWSGRDLMAHLTYWQGVALAVARELALRETSATKVQSDIDWDARGDAWNEEIRIAGLALPMDEVRSRFRLIPGELRGYLTVVPETRWLKNTEYENFFLNETTDHYAAHMADLAAVLAAAAPSAA
jgi:Mycothiol maleylpyruvate isomerase N-terminal domain